MILLCHTYASDVDESDGRESHELEHRSKAEQYVVNLTGLRYRIQTYDAKIGKLAHLRALRLTRDRPAFVAAWC